MLERDCFNWAFFLVRIDSFLNESMSWKYLSLWVSILDLIMFSNGLILCSSDLDPAIGFAWFSDSRADLLNFLGQLFVLVIR